MENNALPDGTRTDATMRDNVIRTLTLDVICVDPAQQDEEDPTNVDEDIPPLDFARYHGLTKDYLSERPLDAAQLPTSLLDTSEDAWTLEVLQGFSTRECLTIDKEAAVFLREVLTAPGMTEDVEVEAGRRKTSDLKQERPILRSDHEWDVRHFGKIDPVDLSRINLPLETINEEKDEGLSWPTEDLDLPARFDARANSERLEIPADTLPYLQEALTNPYCPGDDEAIIAEEIKYQRVSRRVSRLSVLRLTNSRIPDWSLSRRHFFRSRLPLHYTFLRRRQAVSNSCLTEPTLR